LVVNFGQGEKGSGFARVSSVVGIVGIVVIVVVVPSLVGCSEPRTDLVRTGLGKRYV